MACLATACMLAGCSGGTTTATADSPDASASATVSSGTLSAPGVTVGGGVGTLSVATKPDPAQSLFGPWTLARFGDPVCTVDLGSPNAVGDYTAKTRRCASVELARIALWTPPPEAMVLYDFERRPVVTLRQVGPDLFEGQLGGGRITLWR